MQIIILGFISIVGATVAIFFFDGNAKYTTFSIIGWITWGLLTFSWWYEPIIKKWCGVN